MVCCHLAWALLVALCALTYGSIDDDINNNGIRELSLSAPYQHFNDEGCRQLAHHKMLGTAKAHMFRVRVMNGAMNDLGGVNTGAIISEAVQTQDSSFSMEVQFRMKCMLQSSLNTTEIVMQLTDKATPEQGDWVANADGDFNGFAIVMTTRQIPGHELYTFPHKHEDRDDNDHDKSENEDITAALVYRDRRAGKTQVIGSCTFNIPTENVMAWGSQIGIFESSGLRLQYSNSERRVTLNITEEYPAKWRTCTVGQVETKEKKLFEDMRLSFHGLGSQFTTFDVINARVWNTPNEGFGSPPFGFSAKRVLDVHDNDERMIILANAFEHTVIEMKSLLELTAIRIARMVEHDLERVTNIEDMLNQGFLAQVEQRMAVVEGALMNKTSDSYNEKLGNAQESLHERITTKGGELAISTDTGKWNGIYWVIFVLILILGAFAWKALSGGERKASYGGVL
eukprot:437715_1